MSTLAELETSDEETVTVSVNGGSVELEAVDPGGNLKDIRLTADEARKVAAALVSAADAAE